jgi:hypothetical protein
MCSTILRTTLFLAMLLFGATSAPCAEPSKDEQAVKPAEPTGDLKAHNDIGRRGRAMSPGERRVLRAQIDDAAKEIAKGDSLREEKKLDAQRQEPAGRR